MRYNFKVYYRLNGFIIKLYLSLTSTVGCIFYDLLRTFILTGTILINYIHTYYKKMCMHTSQFTYYYYYYLTCTIIFYMVKSGIYNNINKTL